jgi:hypothetical protein
MVVKVLGSSFLSIGKYLKRTNEKKQIMGKLFFLLLFFFFFFFAARGVVRWECGRGAGRVVGHESGCVELGTKKHVGNFTGAWGGIWQRDFGWRFVLKRRMKWWLAQDRRSSLMAAAGRETRAFAGDRWGAWWRVWKFPAMKFSGFVYRVLTIRAVGSIGWTEVFGGNGRRGEARLFLEKKKLFSDSATGAFKNTMPKD